MIWVVVREEGIYLYSLGRESELHPWNTVWSASGFHLMSEEEARSSSKVISDGGIACSAVELRTAPDWKKKSGDKHMLLQYLARSEEAG